MMNFKTFTLRYVKNQGYFWVYLNYFRGSVVLKAEDVRFAGRNESSGMGLFGSDGAAFILCLRENAKLIIGTDVNDNHVVYHVT